MEALKNISDRHFNVRLEDSTIWTNLMIQYLQDIGHIKYYRKSTKEEDEKGKIDYWIGIKPNKLIVPTAFKLREKAGYRDFPVLLRQPFHGIDNERTVVGRDYVSLKGSVDWPFVEQYYVAVKDDNNIFCNINRITRSKLYPMVEDTFASWQTKDVDDHGSFIPYLKFTERKNKQFLKGSDGWNKSVTIWRHVETGTEIWWQKRIKELSPKINSYVPEHYKEESFGIPLEVYQEMFRSFQEIKRSQR